MRHTVKAPLWLLIVFLVACDTQEGPLGKVDGKAESGVLIEGRFPGAATSKTAVTFRGRNFGSQPGAVRLSDGRAATIVSWTDEEVIADLPLAEVGTCSQARIESAEQNESNTVSVSHGDHDLWIPVNEAPAPRFDFASVWTGDEMFIWGGGSNSGWRFNPKNETWLPITRVNAPEPNMPKDWPAPVQNVIALSRKKEILLWGNSGADSIDYSKSFRTIAARYSLVEDAWELLPTENAPSALPGNTAVLAEDRLIIWGGLLPCGGSVCGAVEPNGGIFDLNENVWKSMNANSVDKMRIPIERKDEPRFFHTAVWTGTEMIVWGGFTIGISGSPEAVQSGAAYNPSTDKWRSLPKTGAPSPRGYHVSVWTGTEMIIWGGAADYFSRGGLGDGAAYDPKTDLWRPIAAGPTSGVGTRAVWNGDRLFVYGGSKGFYSSDTPFLLASTYEPVANRWNDLADANGLVDSRAGFGLVWTGNEYLVWGGFSVIDRHPLDMMLSYRPLTEAWSSQKKAANEPLLRRNYSSVWTGKELLIWGGSALYPYVTGLPLNDGARYDPVTNNWVPISNVDAPKARISHRAIWSGAEMIVIGGSNPWEGAPGAGGLYNPATDTWRELPAAPGNFDRRMGHSVVWDGKEALVWGGLSVIDYGLIPVTYATLAFQPESNQWEVLSSSGAPQNGLGANAIWTSAGMFVWTGDSFSNQQLNVGLYEPEAKKWVDIPPVDMQSAGPVNGVWSGKELLLFGSDREADYAALGRGYDVATRQWRDLNLRGAPKSFVVSALWTGTEAFVFRNSYNTHLFDSQVDGFRYKPDPDQWERINTGCVTDLLPVDAGMDSPVNTTIWTGERVLFYGPNKLLSYVP